MVSPQLRNQIESGAYKPQPALIAEAMLQRPGVRDLLTAPAVATASGLNRADRSRGSSEAPRQAA